MNAPLSPWHGTKLTDAPPTQTTFRFQITSCFWAQVPISYGSVRITPMNPHNLKLCQVVSTQCYLSLLFSYDLLPSPTGATLAQATEASKAPKPKDFFQHLSYVAWSLSASENWHLLLELCTHTTQPCKPGPNSPPGHRSPTAQGEDNADTFSQMMKPCWVLEDIP